MYNTESDYLKCCLDSIINQTYRNIEIIIVNDGSSNDCGSICDSYAQIDGRIRVIHQQNQGVAAARNKGIGVAVADWVLFVDSDDWLRLNACEDLNYYLKENECDVLLFNLVKEYATEQKYLNYGFKNHFTYLTEEVNVREYLYRRAMQTPNTGSNCYDTVYYSCDKVYRREFLICNNLQYPVGLPKSEDKVFILRCFEKMKSLFYVEDVLYHYRVHAGNTCNRYSETADVDRLKLARILGKIADRMDQELGKLKCLPSYSTITKDYIRFVFGIISDVLLLKYYHPAFPRSKKCRSIEAKVFISTEPFSSSIRECTYGELEFGAKIKKFLLSRNLFFLFIFIHNLYRKFTKRIARD